MEEGSSGTCHITVTRLQHFRDGSPRSTMEASENEFVARVGVDGRYTYVDPRVVGVLGYLPQAGSDWSGVLRVLSSRGHSEDGAATPRW